ncbi:MAG: hypothetical protein HY075_15280 [Deltaproteobacteria bacterium]|nr:hypothetical protein [Deltaproteobacteria bacterium]
MKNILTVVALAAATMGLVGCDDYVTPSGVVRTAAEKIQKRELKGFKKALTGKALAEYGSSEGMASLEARVAKEPNVRVADAELLSVAPVKNGTFQTAIKTYAVNVLAGQNSRLLTATVLCDIYSVDNHVSHCGIAHGPYAPGAECVEFDRSTELTECKISEIR